MEQSDDKTLANFALTSWPGRSSTPVRPWRGSSRFPSTLEPRVLAPDYSLPSSSGSPTRNAGERSGANSQRCATFERDLR